MATREAVQRWKSVLLDMESVVGLPSGQHVRAQLSTPQARANFHMVNDTPIYGMVTGMLTTLFNDLWSVDPPRDPGLAAVLEPVRKAALAFTPWKELLPQWDTFVTTAHAARQALDVTPMGEASADEIIAEMLLSLKTTLLIAGLGRLGSMTVLAQELARRYASFATLITVPLRYYDLSTNAMVDHPSRTTLSLAAIKAIMAPEPDVGSGDTPGATNPPAVMKQFAAQAIVDFYTDWEEYFRPLFAQVHQCSKYDFRIDYFGDLGKMRHDYVHNRGVCSNSAHCERLQWFAKGDLMVPSSENYLQLLMDFPDDALGSPPQPVQTGRDQVRGSADIPILREFDRLARARDGNLGPALDEALSAWIACNGHINDASDVGGE
ncbi:hypothetical protein [Mycobacterium sp. 23]|uniref:hypothetical protein n=1 Tax=Mycobacterium sp. 23 TaxID=3400424 RepID=UPI003AB039D2